MNRRGLLKGIFAAGMAPAIAKAGVLMPVRKIIVPDEAWPDLSADDDFPLTKSGVYVTEIDYSEVIPASPNEVFGWIPKPYTNEERWEAVSAMAEGRKARNLPKHLAVCRTDDITTVTLPTSQDYPRGAQIVLLDNKTLTIRRYEFGKVYPLPAAERRRLFGSPFAHMNG